MGSGQKSIAIIGSNFKFVLFPRSALLGCDFTHVPRPLLLQQPTPKDFAYVTACICVTTSRTPAIIAACISGEDAISKPPGGLA